MKIGDYLFTYGTLRIGARADLSKSAHIFGQRYIGPDKISGELFTLGGYPGVKEPLSYSLQLPEIIGDVFQITDNNAVICLDAYEGFPTLYTREVVKTEKGRNAWVYVYNHEVVPSNRITNGDWMAPQMGAGRANERQARPSRGVLAEAQAKSIMGANK